VQTTLLGLAMALILALIAALVGPYFIDWNQFRAQFEAEASRVAGTPVRVTGALDARLLPNPTLHLRSVTIGRADGPGQARADKLDVEFSLSDLMRGEWRATELSVNGVALALGLDKQGRIDWPASAAFANLGSLAIDRLSVTGRIALHDETSGRAIDLDDIAFSGDVRPGAAAVRGDGNFMLAGTRYPFRLSSGRTADGSATRLRLTVDPGERAMSLDLEGVVSFVARAPRFDGSIAVARPVVKPRSDEDVPPPWRVVAKLKADPATARFEQIDASYGRDDVALKLTGAADLSLGASPKLQAALAAKQLDIDRLLPRDPNAAAAAPWLPGLLGLLSDLPPAPLPAQIELAADKLLIGGRPIQNLSTTLRSDAGAWTVDRMELRAPGGSQLALTNGLAQPGGFKGSVDIDSADPDLLAAWLFGREVSARQPRPLRASGDVAVADGNVSVERLKAEFDGGTMEGRLAKATLPSGGSRVDLDLKGDRLDIDATLGIVRSLSGTDSDWPEQGALALDFARAVSAGQTWQPLVARLGYSPAAITLEQLKIGAAGGLLVEGAGAFDRTAATGKLSLNATASTLPQLAAAITPVAPAVATRLSAMGDAAGAARIRLAVDLEKSPGDTERARARAVLGIDAPQLKGDATVTATPLQAAIRGTDLDALLRSDVRLETKLSAPRGRPLLALLGLDKVLAAGEGVARFEGSASGAWNGPLRVTAKLAGAVDADVDGTANPWAAAPVADLKLAIRRANVAPLLDLRPADAAAWPVSVTSKLALANGKLSLNDIDGAVAGSRLRGRVAVTLGDENVVDGEAGLDALDVGPALQLVLGAAGPDGAAPLGRGLLTGWRGQVAFQALRGGLPGGAQLQPFSGVVRSDGRSLSLDAIKGRIGGGDVKADLNARPSPDGLALSANLEFAGVDGTALRYRGLAMPAGRTALQLTLSSAGRSPAALAGAVNGSGSLTITGAAISGLDPRAFDVAIRAGDGAQPINETRLGQLVGPALSAGALKVDQAEFPFSIRDGALRINATALKSDAASAIVSGGYDLLADQADLRVSLASNAPGPAGIRPEIVVFAVGPADRLQRTVDVAALSAWLTVRRIDREIGKLQALEREEAAPPAATTAIPSTPPPVVPPATPSTPPVATAPLPDPRPTPAPPRPPIAPRPPARDAVAPLPPPIEIRPAPGSARPPRSNQPLVLTPPPSSLPRTAF
jgi:large subunit ribosomal protein L24